MVHLEIVNFEDKDMVYDYPLLIWLFKNETKFLARSSDQFRFRQPQSIQNLSNSHKFLIRKSCPIGTGFSSDHPGII